MIFQQAKKVQMDSEDQEFNNEYESVYYISGSRFLVTNK